MFCLLSYDHVEVPSEAFIKTTQYAKSKGKGGTAEQDVNVDHLFAIELGQSVQLPYYYSEWEDL